MTAVAFDGNVLAAETLVTNTQESNTLGFRNYHMSKIILLDKPVQYLKDKPLMIGAIALSGTTTGFAVINALKERFKNPTPGDTITDFFNERDKMGTPDWGFTLYLCGIDGDTPKTLLKTKNKGAIEMRKNTVKAPWTNFDIKDVSGDLKSASEFVEVAKLFAQGCGGDIKVYDPRTHKLTKARAWSKARKEKIKELIIEKQLARINKAFE